MEQNISWSNLRFGPAIPDAIKIKSIEIDRYTMFHTQVNNSIANDVHYLSFDLQEFALPLCSLQNMLNLNKMNHFTDHDHDNQLSTRINIKYEFLCSLFPHQTRTWRQVIVNIE